MPWEFVPMFPSQVDALSDGHGNPVAIRFGGPGSDIYCGVGLDDLTFGSGLSDAGFALANGRVVLPTHQDPSRPECAAWIDYGLPAQPVCKIVDGGSCR